MNSEAIAHSTPEETAPEMDAAPITLPNSGEAVETDISTQEFVQDSPDLPEDTPLPDDMLSWEAQKDILISRMDETVTGEAVTTDSEADPEDTIEAEVETEEENPEFDLAEPINDEEEPEIEADPSAEKEEKARQFRLRPRSEVGERAFEIMKGDEFLSEEDAFAQAREQLGVAEQYDSDAPEYYPDPETEPSEYDGLSADDLRSQAEQLLHDAAEQLKEDADFEAFADAQQKSIEMNKAARAELIQESNYKAEFEQARTEAVDKYPVAKDDGSEFTQRVTERYNAWVDLRDPRAAEPDVLMVLSDLVAKELNISPISKGNPAQAKGIPRESVANPPRPQSQATPRRTQAAPPISPASGANRTSTTQLRASAALDQVTNMDDWEAIKASLGM
tara:strand:- start:30426 stop:31601 length:1176 start_codon:yes stop_codon:yes gene_type:complete